MIQRLTAITQFSEIECSLLDRVPKQKQPTVNDFDNSSTAGR